MNVFLAGAADGTGGCRVRAATRSVPQLPEGTRAGTVCPAGNGQDGYGRRGVPPQHGEIQRGHAPVRHDNRKPEVVGQAVRIQRLLVRAVHQKEFPRTGRKAQRNRPEKRENKINNRLSYSAPLRKISCHRQSDKILFGYLLSK